MKNNFLSLLLLTCVLPFLACTTTKESTTDTKGKGMSGRIQYVVVSYMTEGESEEKMKGMGKEKYEMYAESLKNLRKETLEQEYVLLFNSQKSLYQAKDKLSAEDPMEEMQRQLARAVVSGNTSYFNDLEKKRKIAQRESRGQRINVVIPSDKYAWKLTNNTKKIGDYECKEAITYIDIYPKGSDTPVKREITAWYAPVIAAPFGPIGADGLPGMILELHFNEDGAYFLRASEIKVGEGVVEDKNIGLPSGGTEISEKDWEEFNRKEYLKRHQKNN